MVDARCEVGVLGRMPLNRIQIKIAREHVVHGSEPEAEALGHGLFRELGQGFLELFEKDPIDLAKMGVDPCSKSTLQILEML